MQTYPGVEAALMTKTCHVVLGIVDSYGAVHCHKLYLEDRSHPDHVTLWPVAQKRFRFMVRDWDIQKSPLSAVDFTAEDCEAIQSKMRKILLVPEWVLKGEAWNAAGRPRGKAQERFNKKWDASRKIRPSTSSRSRRS